MEIAWTIDYTGEPIDPDDVLGSIFLRSTDGEIVDTCVYLVDWFVVLIDGLLALRGGESLQTDLVSEPDPVVFLAAEGAAKVTYRGVSLTVCVSDLERAIRDSGRRLLDFVSSRSRTGTSLETWARMAEFLGSPGALKAE